MAKPILIDRNTAEFTIEVANLNRCKTATPSTVELKVTTRGSNHGHHSHNVEHVGAHIGCCHTPTWVIDYGCSPLEECASGIIDPHCGWSHHLHDCGCTNHEDQHCGNNQLLTGPECANHGHTRPSKTYTGKVSGNQATFDVDADLRDFDGHYLKGEVYVDGCKVNDLIISVKCSFAHGAVAKGGSTGCD